MKVSITIIFAIIFYGCGSTQSFDKDNLTSYASFKLPDSTKISAPIISENDSSLCVAISGVRETFQKSSLINYKRLLLPNDNLMQRDVVRNTNRTVNYLAFSTWAGIIGTVVILLSK